MSATSWAVSSTPPCTSNVSSISSRLGVPPDGLGTDCFGTLRNRSRYTDIAPSKIPRASGFDGARRIAWSTAFVYVKVWWTVFQSANSLLTLKYKSRIAAA